MVSRLSQVELCRTKDAEPWRKERELRKCNVVVNIVQSARRGGPADRDRCSDLSLQEIVNLRANYEQSATLNATLIL